MNQAVTFGLLFGGGVLLVSAFSGKSIADVVKGHGPFTVSSVGQNLAGGGVSGVGASLAGTTSGPAPAGGTVVGLVTWAQLNAIGAQHGWTGAQISDWANVIRAESNGTLTDTNPSSGAYGIAQFIQGAGEYATYGGNAGTVNGQLTAMANYIAQRYGTPSSAWTFHRQNGWY